jgi:hypothetical protein
MTEQQRRAGEPRDAVAGDDGWRIEAAARRRWLADRSQPHALQVPAVYAPPTGHFRRGPPVLPAG